MKDGKFETRAEIWKYLIEGGRIKKENAKGHYFLKDGELYHSNGFLYVLSFICLEKWSIYEEPKSKKKITLYRYTTQYPNGVIFQSKWCSEHLPEDDSVKVLNIEEKTIEVDDV